MALKRRITQNKFAEFAKRRAGSSYGDASRAAQDRLQQLKEEYANAPASYRGYLSVGICTCLESHIKYYYAAAAEGFDDHPEILKALFKDIQVDIDTLISTTSKTFDLADVIAASITVSSLAAYRERASHFISVFTGAAHDFPWDFLRVFNTNGVPELEKEYALKLDRLDRVFEARHKFVHETSAFGWTVETDPLDDPLECVEDALWLTSQFEKQYEHILMSPKYAAIKHDEGMDDAVGRNLKEIEEAFERIKSECNPRQYESLDKFKNAFLEYLWARCEFQTSVFVAERWEWTTSGFLDLAPDYHPMLRDLVLKQRFLLAQHPIEDQYADMGLEFEEAPSDAGTAAPIL